MIDFLKLRDQIKQHIVDLKVINIVFSGLGLVCLIR
jgi:hypothetical protein